MSFQSAIGETAGRPVSHPAKARVLFIAPHPFFADRGSPLRVRSEVLGLVELGYEVDLLCYPLGQKITLEGVRVLRSPRVPGISSVSVGPSFAKLILDAAMFFAAKELARRERYSVIHGVEEGAYIAAFLARTHKLPFIFDMHSCVSDQLRTSGYIKSSSLLKLIETIEQKCIRRAAGVITVGEEITKWASDIAPAVPGISLQDLPLEFSDQSTPEQLAKLRLELGLGARRVLLYSGNFYHYQGIELMIDAWGKLLRANPTLSSHAALLLVGGGGESNPDFVAAKEQVARLGIANATVFAGQRPASEMSLFHALADIFVSPRIEGVNPPLKIYSYMSWGKPIVATSIRSHTQVLGPGSALFGGDTSDEFARALALAVDPSDLAEQERRSVSQEAKRLVETTFSRGEFLRKLGGLYDSLPRKHLSKYSQRFSLCSGLDLT